MTPTLSTERLTLKPLSKASARQVEWLNDPEIVRYSEQRHREHTMYTQQSYINLFLGDNRIWGIYRIENGAHIGNLTAVYDEPNRVADIGIMIGESIYWGQGYGYEAWNAACDWLLAPDGGTVRKLEAGCMRSNYGMLRIIQKSKFAQEGERVNHFLQGGGAVTAVLFGRFA